MFLADGHLDCLPDSFNKMIKPLHVVFDYKVYQISSFQKHFF